MSDRGDDLFEEELALTGRFVPGRMRSFSSGRVAAREALVRAGAPRCAIPMAADRAPAPPPGWRLSISHADDIAVALACADRDARGLGVDIETVARMDPKLRRHVLGAHDRVPPEAGAERLTACFSLKESLFKALPDPNPERLFVRWDGDAVEIGEQGSEHALAYGWRRAGPHLVSVCILA